MRMPLKKADGAYTVMLHPTALSVSLSLDPLSTAQMTLPPEDEIAVMDWVLIETPDGEAGEYRVSGVETDMESGFQTVDLEHGVCELGDTIIRKSNGHTDGISMKDTISNIVSYICEFSGMWNVGTIAATSTVYIDLGGSTPLDALVKLMENIPEYVLEFDQPTGATWSVNIKARSTTPVCEGRLSRNLTSCKVSRDMSNLVTRVWSEQLTNGKMDSANISLYGVHEQYLSLNDSLSAAQRNAIAASILAAYDHPTLSIGISAVELSQVTGLTLDAFKVGTVCRLTVPWMGAVENETIISKDYEDCLNAPEKVRLTLANAKPDLSISVAPSSRGSGGAQRKTKTDEIARVVHDTDINKTNERILLWATESQWDDIAQQYNLSQKSQFEITSSQIQSTVLETGSTAGVYQFDATHSYVYGEKCIYNGTLYRCKNANGHTGAWNAADFETVTSMQSQITQNKEQIALKVTKGDVATELVVECGNVHVTGTPGNANLTVDGMITATDLAAGTISAIDVGSGTIGAGNITTGDISVADTLTMAGGTLDASQASVYAGDLVVDQESIRVADITVSGNTMTITYVDGTTETFSRASGTRSVRTLTQNGGSVNVGSKVYTVNANIVYDDNSTGTSTIAVPLTIGSYDSQNKKYPLTVAGITGIEVSASGAYDAGYNDGWSDTYSMLGIISITPTSVSASGTNISAALTITEGEPISGTVYKTESKTVTLTGAMQGSPTVTLSTTGTTYSPSNGKVGFSSVYVPGVRLKTQTFSSNGSYSVPANYDGYGTITVSVSGTHTTSHSNCADDLTQINAVSTQQATQMYAYVNGTLTNMGTGYWYKRSSFQQTMTMYT